MNTVYNVHIKGLIKKLEDLATRHEYIDISIEVEDTLEYKSKLVLYTIKKKEEPISDEELLKKLKNKDLREFM